MFHIKCLERCDKPLAWFLLASSKVSVKVIANKGVAYQVSLAQLAWPPPLTSCRLPAQPGNGEHTVHCSQAHSHQISGMARGQAGGDHSFNHFLRLTVTEDSFLPFGGCSHTIEEGNKIKQMQKLQGRASRFVKVPVCVLFIPPTRL
jgi:hypothetical protein